MSKTILVGFDPTTSDHVPVHFGVTVARLTGAPLVVAAVQAGAPFVAMSVGQTLPYGVAQADEDLIPDCNEALREVQEHLSAEGIRVECQPLRGTSAAEALHEAAERDDAGLLVVGSSRRAAPERLLLGSTARRLVHGAPCPVAVVPGGWARDREIRSVGVGYTDSDEGREALQGACALARRAGATLHVLTVVRPGLARYAETDTYKAGQAGRSVEDVEGEYLLAARRELERAAGNLGGDVNVEIDAVPGEPAEELIELSSRVDLLLCGSRGYGPVRAVLLGSVSRRVAEEAHCPVMVLPRGVESALEALLEQGAAAPA
jgi:nucleotide-binding universal stress UspA family protein